MVGTILWHNCWMLKILTYTYSSGILSSLAQTNFHFEVVSCNFRICHYLYFQRDQLAIIQQLKWLWNMTQLGMKPHNSTNAYNFETRTDRFHIYPWTRPQASFVRALLWISHAKNWISLSDRAGSGDQTVSTFLLLNMVYSYFRYSTLHKSLANFQ